MVPKEPEDIPRGTPGPDPDPDHEDRKPLYRDEVPGFGGEADAEATQVISGGPDVEPTQVISGGPDVEATRVRRGETDTEVTQVLGAAAETGAGKRVRGAARTKRTGDDATQVLPRTQRSGYGARSDFDRDEDDEDFGSPPGRLGRRTRLALVVAGVAAVVVIGLAVGYAVLNVGGGATSPGTATYSPGPSAPASASSGSASPDPSALLSDTTMLSAAEAKGLDPKRTWKVTLTQRGVDQNSAQPACLGGGSVDGEPPSQQTVLRLLTASGKKPPGALHRADAYATPEDATQAYGVAAKQLGGCAMTGAYLFAGGVVSGLGDQAVAAVVDVSTKSVPAFRSVVLNRTGRVVNVLDVAQSNQTIALAAVAGTLASVTNAQCRAASGHCAAGTLVKPGPPPIGGDQPGFLAPGDLPPVGAAGSSWAGTTPGAPDPDFTGSGCETVIWAKEPAQRRTARTYVLQDQNSIFGLDTVALTESSAGAAAALVAKVKGDLDSCASRKLTASVSIPVPVSGTGAGGVPIAGWTATVNQKTTEGSTRYRVGIVAAGTKTVFTFLNPQPSLDLTDAQWALVAVRAGERATQVK